MTTQTNLRSIQRRHVGLLVAKERNRRPMRILALPAPTSDTPHESTALQPHADDDLDRATWEDAEWR